MPYNFKMTSVQLYSVFWLFSNINDANSAFFKEFSLGGQNRKKRQNEKYEPSRFGERASLKKDFVKL
jgi:hypothetical protein